MYFETGFSCFDVVVVECTVLMFLCLYMVCKRSEMVVPSHLRAYIVIYNFITQLIIRLYQYSSLRLVFSVIKSRTQADTCVWLVVTAVAIPETSQKDCEVL
jgi:hypothetical protein